MDLVVFVYNKPWVIDEFREGHFDSNSRPAIFALKTRLF